MPLNLPGLGNSGVLTVAAALGALLYLINLVRYITRERRAMRECESWYRATFPEAVHGRRLHCRRCHAPTIRVQPDTLGIPYLEHRCDGCGASLFFSPDTVKSGLVGDPAQPWLKAMLEVTPGLSHLVRWHPLVATGRMLTRMRRVAVTFTALAVCAWLLLAIH